MSRRPPPKIRYESIPCPVCESNSKGCSKPPDGGQLCRGEVVDPAAWVMKCDTGVDGFKLYRAVDPSAEPPAKQGKKTKAPAPVNWSARAVHYASRLDRHTRERLPATLGVPANSAQCIPMLGVSGDTTAGLILTFPEVDADGITVGIVERDPSRPSRGEKAHKSMAGGNRGVTPAVGWDAPTDEPLLLVEGGSGTLAAAAAGLSVLGRPGAENKAAVGYLAEMIGKLPPARPVCIVGDNDPKWNEDGTPKLKKDGTHDWPGRDGMFSTADQLLAAGVPNPIFTVIMPNLFGDTKPLKDIRDGLTDARQGDKPWHQRGAEVLAAIKAAAKPHVAPETPPEPESDATAETGDDPDKWSVEITDPYRLARAYLTTLTPAGSPPRLRYWRSEFHEWQGGAYKAIDQEYIDGRLSNWLNEEFHRVYSLVKRARLRKSAQTGGAVKPLKVPCVTRKIVTDTFGALRGICQEGLARQVEAPCWLDGADGPTATDIVACRNGLVNVVTGELLPHTPSFFTLNAVPYDYDPAAPPPDRWRQFLAEVWPDDAESRDCLQEWFGYLLTGDNSQQKMLYLFGDTRSGKGTVNRVLRGVVGERNVTPTSYKSLDDDFGLWPLLGKSVAVMGDSQSVRGDEIGDLALERILNITGQDAVLINRKNLPMVSASLNTRFVVLSNDLPRVTDTSGAFVGRIVLLHFRQSFLGREDTGLLAKLLAELPGILNWAIAGLRRLRDRGRFVQPASGAAKLNLVRAGASPIVEFVAERCRVGPEYSVSCKSLYEAWVKWCGENGRKEPGTAQSFGMRFFSVPGGGRFDRRKKKTVGEERVWHYFGLRLRDLYDGDDDGDSCPDLPSGIGGGGGRESGHLLAGAGESSCRSSGNGVESAECPNLTPTSAPNPIEGWGTANTYQTRGFDHTAPTAPTFQQNPRVEAPESNTTPIPCPASPYRPWVSPKVGAVGAPPDSDLYFTSDVELVNYPTGTAADVVQDGTTTAYKVTPETVVSLIGIQDRSPAGPDRDRLAAVIPTLCDYLAARYPPDEVFAAEARGPQPLPTMASTAS